MSSLPDAKRALYFRKVKDFYKCRNQLRDLWSSVSTGVLETVPNVDLVEPSPKVFDPSLRQRDLAGQVVQSIAALNEVAIAAIPVFTSLLEEMLVALNLPLDSLHVASLKKSDRAEEKARDDYGARSDGPGLSWLFDMARASVELDDERSIKAVVDYLLLATSPTAEGSESPAEKYQVVARLKNRFKRPTPGGFMDFNLNVRVTIPGVDGRPDVTHVCELQVHHKLLKDYAKGIGSHDVYDFFRKYFSGGTAAVDSRLALMDRIFNDGGGGPDVGVGVGCGSLLSDDASIEKVVEQVCEEGDGERMEATAELVMTMCAYDLAAQIRKAQIDLQGPEHKDTLNTNRKLAWILEDQGKFEEALKLFENVLEGQTRTLGLDHTDTLLTTKGLASVLRNQGKLEEALTLFERVLEGQTLALGPDHHDVLNSTNALACLLYAQKKYEEAKTLYGHVVERQTRNLGPDHEDTLNTTNNLASALDYLEKKEEALKLYERVVEGHTRTLGAGHMHTLMSTMNLAGSLYNFGKKEEAKKMFARGLEASTQSLGPDHPLTTWVKEALEKVRVAEEEEK